MKVLIIFILLYIKLIDCYNTNNNNRIIKKTRYIAYNNNEYNNNKYLINEKIINRNHHHHHHQRQHITYLNSDHLGVVSASLIASALGGSIGIGVAYPLDSIKTKTQSAAAAGIKSKGMKKMFIEVYKSEGFMGFYNGLLPAMLGQSLYISAAFASNAWALTQLVETDLSPNVIQLALAGSFGGLVASFVINPIERLKIQMQISNGEINDSYECLIQTIKSDGFHGLLFRGIDATLWREVPGYALYFLAYSYLSQQAIDTPIEPYAPLLCGAFAGAISWVPIYPFDVIKTNMQSKQNIENNINQSMIRVATDLKDKFGWNIFFNGLTPKLYRAVVADSVTFMTYEMILKYLGITSVISS